ncbi:MAG: protein kinase [Proteobacteria bacterium]|nr:protein kinase [Pseudomonadota bacterium]
MARCPTCYRRLNRDDVCPEHGRVPVKDSPASNAVNDPPPVLEAITVARQLAAGGFASVWECSQDSGPSPVIVKVGRSANKLARTRFQREANSLARIRPPHVPELYRRGILDDGRPYLIMEHLGYETLATRLQSFSQPPALQWVRSASSSILKSLEATHACGVVHRDLKPENIFLSDGQSGIARLIDFGITKNLAWRDEDITRTGTILGTPEYMAPEQVAAGGDIDFRADIYTFGIILYEFLTLRVPFSGEPASIEHGHQALRPPRPSQFADVPQPLEEVCLSCLAKARQRRPANATSLREMLERACDAAIGTTRRPTTKQPSAGRLLTNAQQPVILLVALLDSLGQDVGALVARHKGVIARQWGKRYICAFSGLMDRDPMREAIAAARELCDRLEARVVLHLASLKLRRSRQRGTLKVYGSEVEHPERWLPDSEFTGTLLTNKIAKLLPPESIAPDPSHDGFCTLTSEPIPGEGMPALTGRADILTRAEASLCKCLDSGTPGLFTVMGEHGIGKSRLAYELTLLARRAAPPEAKVVEISASRRGLRDANTTCKVLLSEIPVDTATETDPDIGPVSSEMPELALVRSLGNGMRRAARARPFILIIDDAHHADSVMLDALEYATLDNRDTRLWIAAVADPRLEQRRPQWGERAYRHDRITLEPLSKIDAMKLTAELLRPVEYPPAATLRRLALWTGGNPQLLTDLVRTLKQTGIVRCRPDRDHWYIATAELDELPPSPVGQWMATRTLDALPPELAACARLCSVLGVEFLREELHSVVHASELADTASTPVDVDVGLIELGRRGILDHANGQVWWFKQANFQASVYQLLAPADCEQIHRYALAFWRSRGESLDMQRVLSSIARHAGACNERKAAADAHLVLGDRAQTKHHNVEADTHYTSALRFLSDDDDTRRLYALAGRAKVRYRMQRNQEALDDLRVAGDLARQANDDEFHANLLLESATVLDWMEQYVESAQLVDRARAIITDLYDPVLDARLLMARGRSCWRREQFVEAVALLSEAARQAEDLDDHETQILALILLGPALVFSGRTAEAHACFDEVIALCERVGDGIHLCAAYANRLFLWRNQPERAIADLRQSNRLARELGQPGLERITTHNLAEILHWAGDDNQALLLAQRARALQRHVSPDPVPDDSLLLARIHASLGEHGDVRRLTTWVRDNIPAVNLAPSDEIVLTMLELFIGDEFDEQSASAWDSLIERARGTLPNEEFLEVLYFRVRASIAANRMADSFQCIAEAHRMLAEHSIFERRFAALIGGQLPLFKLQ